MRFRRLRCWQGLHFGGVPGLVYISRGHAQGRLRARSQGPWIHGPRATRDHSASAILARGRDGGIGARSPDSLSLGSRASG